MGHSAVGAIHRHVEIMKIIGRRRHHDDAMAGLRPRATTKGINAAVCINFISIP